MAIIDIAVPRDVDDDVKEIEGVSLFNIDDLDGVIKVNLKKREDQTKSSEKIMEEESEKFMRWMGSLDLVPTIVSLRDKYKRIGKEELKKTISTWDDITEEEKQRLHRLTSSVINKILHDPTVFLKKEASEGGVITKSLINELFGLVEGCGDQNQDRNKG
jgi:glutamyl-tRNA reductase